MHSSNYDVVVVGAGAAGLTAAIGLAKAGFAVAVVEAAAFPGAENWSGCVYFTENLAHPDILGPDGVEELAWERRLVERGFFATDGHSILGMTYRDPAAFKHCFTVLRPIYDHHLGQIAIRHGVALLTETTAESLIRDSGRVVGVCTQRGPLYADLVFLAEGDASHLVTREGYERHTDHREAPKFLQGIKQVIDLPPGAIENTFGVGPDEGAAYEMLLRNGTLRGRNVHLNMGGFVYTNRQSLSVGLVLPADNLAEHFDGDPNLLIEWFENLPALQPWLEGGRRGVFGAKIIRGGGVRDVPALIDEGLAIGGAASAVGVDFPYPNFTGPATAMGLLLVQAARRIRGERTGFTREALRRHYFEPLRKTHYWKDVEFLRRWPGYVKRTRVFFDTNIDLALGTAYVWTRPNRWFITKWTNWLRFVGQMVKPANWQDMGQDVRHLSRALRLREVAQRPDLGKFLLDGTVNALRDIFGRPRADLPQAGALGLHYGVAGNSEPLGLPPKPLRLWFNRFAPILAAAAQSVYTNNTTPLAAKLPGVVKLLMRQVNVLDVVAVGAVGLATSISAGLMKLSDRLRRRRRLFSTRLSRLYTGYAQDARRATDLTTAAAAAAQNWEARLGRLPYQTVKASHIHVLWPQNLADKNGIVKDGLWHVCPAHVYETRAGGSGQVQVIVNFENCIKCETCWRTGSLVDWGRDGRHRFIYAVPSPVVTRLLDAVQAAGSARPMLPRALNWWEPAVKSVAGHLQEEHATAPNAKDAAVFGELRRLLSRLERKLEEFDEALAEEPRHVDQGRAEYLEMLARYGQQLAEKTQEIFRDHVQNDELSVGLARAYGEMGPLITALVVKTQERAQRTWNRRYSWAAADGRQLRWHHLAGLRQFLDVFDRTGTGAVSDSDPVRPWLRSEEDNAAVAAKLAGWSARLDAVFPPGAWRDLEQQRTLSSEADAVLRDLIAQVPVVEPQDLAGTLHPPLRKALLADLGRRDPSLAYRAASHLWARDLARLSSGSAAWNQAVERMIRADEWACFMSLDAVLSAGAGWRGEALFVPARNARTLVLLFPNQLAIVPAQTAGLWIEPLATLGLRGAGMARVRLDGLASPETRATVDHDRVRRVWSILSSADLTSIAFGMADQLCRRTLAHAGSRVQFPGLFHDEQGRDSIGKFGAVKKMVAEMFARRYLIETLDHTLAPADFAASTWERAGLIKALAAEALGTAPGSLSYNAGQVFGGTGYSEDDILAKYYRDASAWRFLGVPNSDVYRRHGRDLLRSWRPDGQRLAGLPDEADLFDQVVQRKALLGELDEVRNARSRLRAAVSDWQAKGPAHQVEPAAVEDEEQLLLPALPPGKNGIRQDGADPVALAEMSELLARQNAHLLASKALVLRTHAHLEVGRAAEVEIALTRVWLQFAAGSLDDFKGTVQRLIEPSGQNDHRPLVELTAGPPVTSYADYLAAPCPYDSGDFLTTPVNLVQPRLVPDMIHADPDLARADREIKHLLTEHFGPLRDGGLIYERYIERNHRPDDADLDFCRQHGFFRMPIPRELGGEGRRKIDYYLVTMNAQALVDVGISLAIQANTSIGTTPVLLARDKDLPKAQKELAAFVADTNLQREIEKGLEELKRTLRHQDPARLKKPIQSLQKRLDEAVFGRSAVRIGAYPFAKAWQRARGQAASEFDAAALEARMTEALAAWKRFCADAVEMVGAIGRRRKACDLFLRWVAQGQISAFALTEPSAGSDTARVATRAKLRSVPVEVEPDGVMHFIPEGGKEPRHLLDADRLVFEGGTAGYRWSPDAEPAPIHFEQYDYETDDPGRIRFYDHGRRRVHFTDIAQLRERDGKLWYHYWELTGAKMWTTNGRMCGVMCLYAKTDDSAGPGVTGFIVDRHAEGLIVGQDEEKLGQCGSPTNELSLQAVRVPRENIIGLEGRGQVNALDTLNVGRAGLATSAVAQMERLIESSRAFARATYGEIPDWVQWRLARMEEIRFTSEALAFEVIGRFEHPQTRSARMESAIAKMFCSEALHTIIEWAEEIRGLAGQTQLHLVEKRKRDARVLNIYEGTNEVQRFSILKDLATEIGPRWSQAPAAPPAHLSRDVLELEVLKGTIRQRLQAALTMFGQSLWQNPNLQADCFLLAEAAAWIKAADSTLLRLAWLSRQEVGAGDDGAGQDFVVSGVARRALAQCYREIQHRLERFEEELTHLRRGYYAPEVRAASLLFDEATETPPAQGPASQITRPLALLVVLDPLTVNVPHPQVAGGRLLEPYRTWSDADRAALEAALQLKATAAAPVTLQVVAVGPRGTAPALREALNLGADRVRLVVPESEVTPDSAASALAAVLGTETIFDLVLGGSGDKGSEDGLVARLTAEALGVRHAGTGAHLAVQTTEGNGSLLLATADSKQQRVRSLPAAVGIEAEQVLRHFTVAGYLAGLSKSVEVVRWPRTVAARAATFLEGLRTTARSRGDELPQPLSPEQAAERVLDEMGLHGTAATAEPFEGDIEDAHNPDLLEATISSAGKVVAVLAAEADGRLQASAAGTVRAAHTLAARLGATTKVLLLAAPEEERQRRALGHLREWFEGDTILAAVSSPGASPEIRARLLAQSWPELTVAPRAIVGEPWTEGAFAALAYRPGKGGTLALRVWRVEWEDGQLALQTSRSANKLAVRQIVDLNGTGTCWLSVTEDVEIGGAIAGGRGAFRVQRWTPRLERFFGQADIQLLLRELKQETGQARLADAEFIVDVGFGVGNQDGYDAVIEPLVKALHDLGVRNLLVGGSRKVTEELHLLPPDRQIGQSGVSVNPRILLAIGISGAPQHLNYIGPRATILAFNQDADAPIMTLNQRQAQPRVFPVVGNLFETVPAFLAALQAEGAGKAEQPDTVGAV
jgi:electron transfer flavoprotein-quinone oxidoreductase